MDRPVWAGVLPMALQPLAPLTDAAPTGMPDYVRAWASTASASATDAEAISP